MKSDVFTAVLDSAKWIVCPSDFASPVIIRRFTLENPAAGKIAMTSLGFYSLYINGKRVGNEYFLPSNSIFRFRDSSTWIYPLKEEYTYRCYVSEYDIASYLVEGENVLEIRLGDGWYRQKDRTAEGNMQFGEELGARYALVVTDNTGVREIVSDGSEMCRTSATVYSQLFYGEIYDARIERDQNYTWAPVSITELPETLLTPEEAPPERVIRRITPKLLSATDGKKIYDAGENISGLVKLSVCPAEGEEVHIRCAENLTEEGELSFDSTGCNYKSPDGRPQIMEDVFIGDGETHVFMPQFVWHAFRYFEITGEGTAVSVEVIHNDTPVTAAFRCDAPEINWLFEAYVRTQLSNMHGGHPSDCPHRERLGYTGDGQVCAHAAMAALDCQSFYRKWIRDIFDSQDKITGHINHTAPFGGGGGGPGGWGCAAIIVPYQYYKAYGDTSLPAEYFDHMMRWIGYLQDCLENGLLVRETEGGWCLGDWCTLDECTIPAPLVNTCYYIHALKCMEEFAAVLGRTEEASMLAVCRASAEKGVLDVYYDPETGSFCEGVQGADAYGIWAGLGDARTFRSLCGKYHALGHFDTGFLGTDILCQVLLQHGGEDTACKLLTSHEKGSFGYIMDQGSSTIWETWSSRNISNSHPMFGASAGYLLTEILGIGQTEDSIGYHKIRLAPKVPAGLQFAEGYMTLPQGKVEVSWRRTDEGVSFTIGMPENGECEFVYAGTSRHLDGGRHTFVI